MPYQLLRPAANRGSYSDRMAKIGKPYANLRDAFGHALRISGAMEIMIQDTGNPDEWGTVYRARYLNNFRGRPNAKHISLSLPPEWLAELAASDRSLDVVGNMGLSPKYEKEARKLLSKAGAS